MTFLFWDIDGTLLTTGRAGIHAWEDACLEVLQQQRDLMPLKTDGLTDHQVARLIMLEAGIAEDSSTVARMIEVYERQLPDRLHSRKGRALTSVREILNHLRLQRLDVHSALLTGNTAAGARAKLTHYGLWEFFQDGAFSVDLSPRADIAKRAVDIARTRVPGGELHPHRLFVIGDTPHDIVAGRAIGARTIAVASGVHSVQDLASHSPWKALEALPDPVTFEKLIDA